MTIRIITHSGSFHLDDVTSYAILNKIFPQNELIRTRDMDVINTGDIVFDVGLVYDEVKFFDHHQRNSPTRPDGTMYSACGLIWKHFGRQFLEGLVPNGSIEEVWTNLDNSFIRHIDLDDTGTVNMTPVSLSEIVNEFNPSFDGVKDFDGNFRQAANLVLGVILRKIEKIAAGLRAKFAVFKALVNRPHPQILVLDQGMPWKKTIGENQEVVFCIHPGESDWCLYTRPSEKDYNTPRKRLPHTWAGRTGAELEKISGVPGALFCHTARFIATAKTFEAAYAMALKALKAGD